MPCRFCGADVKGGRIFCSRDCFVEFEGYMAELRRFERREMLQALPRYGEPAVMLTADRSMFGPLLAPKVDEANRKEKEERIEREARERQILWEKQTAERIREELAVEDRAWKEYLEICSSPWHSFGEWEKRYPQFCAPNPIALEVDPEWVEYRKSLLKVT